MSQNKNDANFNDASNMKISTDMTKHVYHTPNLECN